MAEETDPLRGTGRTTRMLEQAVAAAQDGELVGIGAHTYAYARVLCKQAVRMGAPADRVVPLSVGGSSHISVDRAFHDHYTGGNRG